MMSRPLRVPRALAALLLLASSPLPAGGSAELPSPLKPFEARYQVTDGKSRLGFADIGLEPAAEGWRYYSVLKPEGLYALLVGRVEDETLLERHAGGLRPLRFTHDAEDAREDARIEFDWTGGEARVITEEGEQALPLESGTHDQFSAILAVMQEFANGDRQLQLPSIDDGGELEPLRFRHSGTTSVETPLGTFEAVHVRRIREHSRRETESWLAPELDWIPVRIDQSNKGELTIRMELVGFNGRNADLGVDSPR